jgi:hypothetical protein
LPVHMTGLSNTSQETRKQESCVPFVRMMG